MSEDAPAYTSLVDELCAIAATTFAHTPTPEHPVPELATRVIAAIRKAETHPHAGLFTSPLRRELDHLTHIEREAAVRVFQAQKATTERAVLIALEAHTGHMRKDGDTPYIAHPIAVAMHLAEAHYNDAVIGAALVHDVVEDTAWTRETLARALDDPKTMALVDFATELDKSHSWEVRKEAVITKLIDATDDQAALVIADKGHNLRNLLQSASEEGIKSWDKFNRGRDAQSWFAYALAAAVATRHGEPFDSFETTVREAFADQILNPLYRHTPTNRR